MRAQFLWSHGTLTCSSRVNSLSLPLVQKTPVTSRILGKYGIQASIGSEDVASVAPTRHRLPEESEDEPRG